MSITDNEYRTLIYLYVFEQVEINKVDCFLTLFVCLEFFDPFENILLVVFGDVTIAGEGVQNLT